MHKVTVDGGNSKKILWAEDGELLSKLLLENNIAVEHPCGGRGTCKKCTVIVNGESVLSCKYVIKGDTVVGIPIVSSIATASFGEETDCTSEEMCLCLDLGTTTMVLALMQENGGKIVKSVTRNNPQRAFAADVMSRVEYAAKNGTEKLRKILIEELNCMLQELCAYEIDTLYVAGNTVMLHLFFGTDPSGVGRAPYTPVFLEQKNMPAEYLGIKNVGTVISLPGISAFVGADIVAGLGYVGDAEEEKYNFLVDLGTNAEVVLYSKDKLYCTAAAAGPCFEGVNISSGMSATEGAIYSVSGYGHKTIGDCAPKGICATGLIDAMALMLDYEVIDETGFMEEKEFEVAEGVRLTQGDVRQFQLAKSAICSAMEALRKKADIDYDCIDKVFVAGGFSSKMNIGNAVKVGLFQKGLREKICPVNNSCLLGLVKYASTKSDLSHFTKKAEYVDLAADEYFQDLFIENMGF